MGAEKRNAAQIAEKVGWDPKFVIFKEILDKVTQDAVAELVARWKDRLAMADARANHRGHLWTKNAYKN